MTSMFPPAYSRSVCFEFGNQLFSGGWTRYFPRTLYGEARMGVPWWASLAEGARVHIVFHFQFSEHVTSRRMEASFA